MDISFGTEIGRFNYRVGAIIIHDQQLLMVKNARDPYYYSVGGRVQLHESTEAAILREVFEETGVCFEIDRLGYILESFFVLKLTREVFHELSFFYFMKPIDNIDLVNNSTTEDGIEEQLVWIPLSDLDQHELYPAFFKTNLINPSNNIIHIVVREY